jgi:hypothetical protein
MFTQHSFKLGEIFIRYILIFDSHLSLKTLYKKHSYQGKIPSHAGFGCRTSANQKTFLTLAAMLNFQMKRK